MSSLGPGLLRRDGVCPPRLRDLHRHATDLAQALRHAHCRSVLQWQDMSRNQSLTKGSKWILRRSAALLLGSSSTRAAAGVGGGVAQRWYGRPPHVLAGARWRLLVATSPAAASGHHTEPHGGGGCTPKEHFHTAAASWSIRATAAACLVANSDQQTGPWQPARHARRRARMSPGQPTRMSDC